MSESPTPDHAAVKNTLAEKIEANDDLKKSEELAEIKTKGSIAENVQALRSLLVAGKETDGSEEKAEEVEAEKAALKAAITETAAEHKDQGVTETLIMIWINGGDIATQLEALDTKGIKTYKDLKNDPEAIKVIQRIGVSLGLDLGEYGDNKDGADGNYGGKTVDAWAQVQAALKGAGYDLGEFGAANDGVDGKVGKTTLNILMQAAKGVAPADVVEAAAEEAKSPEAILAGARTEMRPPAGRGDFAPDDFIGPPAPATVKPATEVGPEVSDKARNEITAFVDTKLPGLKVEGDNLKHFAGADPLISQYIGADGNPVFTKLEADYHKENKEFAAENDVAYTQNHAPTNEAGFEHDGRFVLLQEVATAEDPKGFIQEHLKDVSATPGIPAEKLAPLMQQVVSISGVKSIESADNYTVVLFNGDKVPLGEVYQASGRDLDPLQRHQFLRNKINTAAKTLATSKGLIFVPEITAPAYVPAQFQQDAKMIFTLSELTKGELNASVLPALDHPERETIFKQALDSLT